MKIDLACGQNKAEGFYGIDCVAIPGVDQVVDLEVYPWPLESNVADEVFSSHYVEHVSDLIAFMNEVHRICKPGARVTWLHPYYSSIRCWQDPTHKNALSEASWWYYNEDWRKFNKLDHYPITANFGIESFTWVYNESWANREDFEKEYARKHMINVVDDLIVRMKAIK